MEPNQSSLRGTDQNRNLSIKDKPLIAGENPPQDNDTKSLFTNSKLISTALGCLKNSPKQVLIIYYLTNSNSPRLQLFILSTGT